MGTTTIAALLGPVLATTRAGTVRILDATPHAGALAARLLSSPASAGVDGAARLEVRTVDPAAVCAAEQPAGDDVTVVDVGAELAAAARSGLFGWADRLVFVRCDSGEAGPGQAMPRAIPVDALVAAGYKALAQHAVTVSIAHDPPATPAEPAPCLSVDGHGQAVVRIPFDAHLATGGVLDLDQLSPATAAAARQLATLVTGSSSPDLASKLRCG
jgi:MinD-like ATPase involved in chromosome partitioning or flagellar assembly